MSVLSAYSTLVLCTSIRYIANIFVMSGTIAKGAIQVLRNDMGGLGVSFPGK